MRGPGAEFHEILGAPLPGRPAREAIERLHGVGARDAGVAVAVPHFLCLEKCRHHGSRGVVVTRLVDLVVEADSLERGAESHRGRFQTDVAFAGVENHRVPRQHAVVVTEDVFVKPEVLPDGGIEEPIASAGLIEALRRPERGPFPHQLLELLPVPVDPAHVVVHPHEGVEPHVHDLGSEPVRPLTAGDDRRVAVGTAWVRPQAVVFAVEQVREMRLRLRLDDLEGERRGDPRIAAVADPGLHAIPARREGERLGPVEVHDEGLPLVNRRNLVAEQRQPPAGLVHAVEFERVAGRQRLPREHAETDPE